MERVWGYQGLLAAACEQALDDEALLSEAAQALISKEELRQVLDIPEELLWQPCLSQLSSLRHIDTERDDMRARIAAPLDYEHQILQREIEASAPRSKTLDEALRHNRARNCSSQLDLPERASASRGPAAAGRALFSERPPTLGQEG